MPSRVGTKMNRQLELHLLLRHRFLSGVGPLPLSRPQIPQREDETVELDPEGPSGSTVAA